MLRATGHARMVTEGLKFAGLRGSSLRQQSLGTPGNLKYTNCSNCKEEEQSLASKKFNYFNFSAASPENLPDKLLTQPIMVLENSKLVKMTVPHIAPWLPMCLSGNTLLLKLFPKN